MTSNEQRLVEAIISLDDLFEATDALTDLSEINAAKARELAFDILRKERGDVHLQASAFDIVYSLNQQEGLAYIQEAWDTPNAYLFRQMLDWVTQDSSFVNDNPALLAAVRTLNKRLPQLTPEQLEIVDENLEWFKRSYAVQLEV